MRRYTPEEIRYELCACWTVDKIADLMAKAGLQTANVLNVLDAPTYKDLDIIWLACAMSPVDVGRRFARRCAEDSCSSLASRHADSASYHADSADNCSGHLVASRAYDAAHAASLSYVFPLDSQKKYRRWLKEEVLR